MWGGGGLRILCPLPLKNSTKMEGGGGRYSLSSPFKKKKKNSKKWGGGKRVWVEHFFAFFSFLFPQWARAFYRDILQE